MCVFLFFFRSVFFCFVLFFIFALFLGVDVGVCVGVVGAADVGVAWVGVATVYKKKNKKSKQALIQQKYF